MAYQVLARKWRPQSFAEVVGQDAVATALGNALSEGRVAQAYLFSGIRGVGKTSVARIFAKALNCERGPRAEPCNECVPCREITAGGDLDVLEVDAATYSKVEQVRELTESLKYGAARDRYKVVIIDEIHRLSRHAFDALLKIVEEPPPRLVFIFATTESESVPATILSRCQEFRFRRVAIDPLAAHLERIAAAESIDATPNAVRLLARAGDGSVRDAVALLDQLATFGSGTVDEKEAAALLGGLDRALFQELLAAILDGRGDGVGAAVARVESEGWEPRHVFNEFLSFCRSALHLALGVEPETLALPGEEARALARMVRPAGYESLLRLLHLLLESEEMVRRSESALLALEIAWLRAAEQPKLRRLEELLGGGTVAAPPAGSAPGAARNGSPPAAANDAAPATASGAAEPAVAGSDVERFLDQVSRRKQLLAAHLSEAERLELVEQRLTIVAPARDRWLAAALERTANVAALEQAIAAVWGEGIGWRLEEGDAEPPAAAPKSPVLEDPRVQSVLEVFGGSVESVEQAEGGKKG